MKNQVLESFNIIGYIYETTNQYDRFRFITGNREIDKGNLKKITASLNKFRVKENAILVVFMYDEKTDDWWFYVVDGHHRFQACRDLNIPVSFVVINDLEVNIDGNLLTVIEYLNTASKEWDVTNFMGSKAALGNEHYINYANVYNKYSGHFEHEILFHIMALKPGRKDIRHQGFREGKLIFDLEDQLYVDNKLNILKQCSAKLSHSRRYYLKSLVILLTLPTIDVSRMRRVMTERVLPVTDNVDTAQTKLMELYNRGQRVGQIGYDYIPGGKNRGKIKIM